MPERVCLIDVDSKIPNLALMRALTYYKGRGDSVKLGYDPMPERITGPSWHRSSH